MDTNLSNFLPILGGMIDSVLEESFPYVLKSSNIKVWHIEIYYGKVIINHDKTLIYDDIYLVNILEALNFIRNMIINSKFNLGSKEERSKVYKINQEEEIQITYDPTEECIALKLHFKGEPKGGGSVTIHQNKYDILFPFINSAIKHARQFIKIKELKDAVFFHPDNNYCKNLIK